MKVNEVKEITEVEIGQFSILIDEVHKNFNDDYVISFRAYKRSSRIMSLDLRHDELVLKDTEIFLKDEEFEPRLSWFILRRLK